MKVLIPAGGKGTRLRPHTFSTPKPLLFVAGETVIGHIFSMLEGIRIDEYRIVFSPETSLPRVLKEAYPDMSFTFWEQTEPLGLGHAVLQGLENLNDEPLLILLSDTIIPFDISSAISNTSQNEGFLAAKEVADPRRFGVVEVEGLYISNLVEKPENPRSNLAISGVYYLPSARRLRQALTHLIDTNHQSRGEYQLTDALSILINQGEKLKVVTIDKWIDCGTPQALLDANCELLKMNSRIIPVEGSLVKPPCWIGEDVVIENSIIGPNVSIDRGAVIKNSIVSRSIINRQARLEGMVISNSIIGEKAVLKCSPASPQLGAFSTIDNS